MTYEDMTREELIAAIHELIEERDELHEEGSALQGRYNDLCWEVSRFMKGVVWDHDVEVR